VIDDVLIAEIRDQLRDQGLSDDEIDFQIAGLKDDGMFEIPGTEPDGI
jgi:hypothetical protein